MTTETLERATARDRLLAAATELFYEEGIHVVGIDRVIERAGVAKATLYSAFGSKDGLIKAYLLARHELIKSRITTGLERFGSPRERLVGVFELQGETFARPGYRGCAFLGASAEASPESMIPEVASGYRRWLRDLVRDLAEAAGAGDPEDLARQLLMIYDGAGIAAWIDRDSGASERACAIAASLVSAALPA